MDENQDKLELLETPHPGEMLQDYLEDRAWTQRELARRTGITPKTISEICSGKASISANTALAFEKTLQRPAHFWLNLQRQHDESEARSTASRRQEHWHDWADNFPLAELKKWRLIPASTEKADDVDSLLSFFAVSSPESWASVWESAGVAYRQTRQFTTRVESIATWVRAVEVSATQLHCVTYEEANFRSVLSELKAQTRKPVDSVMDPIQEICCSAGVVVVWVPAFQHTGISGCARWMDDTPVIGLSDRYKTDDQMWFTFFHEAGHILLHRKRCSFVLDNAAESLSDRVVDPQMRALEEEANQFAADTLIDPYLFEEFVRRGDFGNDAVHDFAEAAGTGPGIVVGRLQHEGILKPHQGNRLKQKLRLGLRG